MTRAINRPRIRTLFYFDFVGLPEVYPMLTVQWGKRDLFFDDLMSQWMTPREARAFARALIRQADRLDRLAAIAIAKKKERDRSKIRRKSKNGG